MTEVSSWEALGKRGTQTPATIYNSFIISAFESNSKDTLEAAGESQVAASLTARRRYPPRPNALSHVGFIRHMNRRDTFF